MLKSPTLRLCSSNASRQLRQAQTGDLASSGSTHRENSLDSGDIPSPHSSTPLMATGRVSIPISHFCTYSNSHQEHEAYYCYAGAERKRRLLALNQRKSLHQCWTLERSVGSNGVRCSWRHWTEPRQQEDGGTVLVLSLGHEGFLSTVSIRTTTGEL